MIGTRKTDLLLASLLLAAIAAALLLFYAAWPARPAEPPTYSRIEPGLYLGGHGAPPPDATAILNLSQYADDYTAPIYLWQPISDGMTAPSHDWLAQQVAFVDAQRKAGRTVFVHCDAGRSRSALVVMAYLMWREHWGRDQTLAFLQKARRVQPNPAFMKLLLEWEKPAASRPAIG